MSSIASPNGSKNTLVGIFTTGYVPDTRAKFT